MRSIFLISKKSVFRLLLTFLLTFQFENNGLTQNSPLDFNNLWITINNLNNSSETIDFVPLNEYETKTFLQNLVNQHGPDLLKWKSGAVVTLTNACTLSDENSNKYNLIIKLDGSKLTFTAKQSGAQLPKDNFLIDHLNKLSGQILNTTVTNSAATNPQTITLSSRKSNRHFYNDLLRKYQRPKRGFVSISSGFNFAYRILSATNASNKTTENFNARQQNEYALQKYSFSARIGGANYSHHYALSYTYQEFGFAMLSAKEINAISGEYNTQIDNQQFVKYTNSFGFQYAYSNYWKKWSPYVQLGINVALSKQNKQDSEYKIKNYFGTYINSGIGISYKPWYRAEFHLCPTGLIFLNSKNATLVNTRYFSLGLELGAQIYLNNRLNK